MMEKRKRKRERAREKSIKRIDDGGKNTLCLHHDIEHDRNT